MRFPLFPMSVVSRKYSFMDSPLGANSSFFSFGKKMKVIVNEALGLIVFGNLIIDYIQNHILIFREYVRKQ